MKQNKTTLIIVLTLLALQANAQSVISAGGAAYENNNAQATVTIGEATIGATGSDATVEIGFQQAYESETVSIEETLSSLQLTLYPNPTAHKVTITNEQQQQLNYILYQLDGKVLNTGETADMQIELSLQNQPVGLYFAKFTNQENNTTKTFKIIKK